MNRTFKIIKFISFFTLFFINCTYAEVVKKIEVEGNKRISLETIKVYGDIKINKDYGSNDINRIIKDLYSTNFFEDINITISSGTLKIFLTEYPLINSIELEGEKSNKIKEAIIEMILSKEKGSFIKNMINQDVITIKKLYASVGYNFTEVETKIEKFSENRVNLLFKVNKGDQTKISKIYFTGDKKIRERRLRDVIVSEEDKFWKVLSKNTKLNYNNIDLDKRLLVKYYKSVGFYDAQVLSSNAEIGSNNMTSLTYTINAGTRYKIKKISTDINPVIDKDIFLPLKKNYNKAIGKYYSPFIVKKFLDEVDSLIANNDLQFIEHSVNEIIDNDTIEIQINIFEGSKQLVERINVTGNTITNESVIRGELLIDEGDPFNNLKLEKSISRLKSRRIFSEVKENIKEGSSKDLKIIDINVEEMPTGEISAGAGFGTNGGSVAFNVTENNWLGKGIKLNTQLEVDQDSIKGSLSVNEPNYNLSGNSLNYFISSSSNEKPNQGYENSIISGGIGTSFEQYRNIYFQPGMTFEFDDLTVQNNASKALKKQAGSFTELAFDYGISADERDRSFMPTSGYYSSFTQQIPIYADTPYIKNSYRYSKYNQFGEDIVGVVKFYGSAINGMSQEDVRISKRLYLPSSRLRGFKKGAVGPKDGPDFIGGNFASAINIEANLPNLLPESTKTDVGLFFDVGNIWGIDYDSSLDDGSKWRSSVGSNISWISPLGPMTFVLSQNITKGSTDETESFNFRLGTTF